MDKEQGMPYPNAAKRPPLYKRVFRHLIRYWWAYLILFLLGALGLILGIIYGVAPAIAQHDINNCVLDVNYQGVLDPKPDSVHLVLNNTLRSNSSFHPTVRTYSVALFLEDTMPDIKPFGYIQVPEFKTSASTNLFVDQTLQITDLAQFTRYCGMVLSQSAVRLAMRGRVPIKLGGLPLYTKDFNKVVTIPALNNLQGFQIEDFEISLAAQPDDTNMVGTVIIPNDTPMELALGTITMNLFVNGEQIGTTTLPDTTLKPWTQNKQAMRARVDQAKVLSYVAGEYKGKKLPVEIRGNRTVNADGDELVYYSVPLQQSVLHTELDVAPALAKLGLQL